MYTAETLHKLRSTGCIRATREVAQHLPSKVSTESCRPRLCRGLTTQWLLVAVMSNTSQPSSEAQRVRLSSRNRSDSLQERRRETQAPGQQVTAQSPSHPTTDGDEERVRRDEAHQSPKRGCIRPRSRLEMLSSCAGERECTRRIFTHRRQGAARRQTRPSDLLGGCLWDRVREGRNCTASALPEVSGNRSSQLLDHSPFVRHCPQWSTHSISFSCHNPKLWGYYHLH